MPDSASLNHAARIVAAVSPATPADAALRHYFVGHRHLGPRERRAISRAVFAYFRWLQWLDARASLQKQIAHAAELHERFAADPRSVKPETLAARVVPAWLRDEMDLPPGFFEQLQRDPPIWLRARPGAAEKLARDLGDCVPPDLSSQPSPLGTPLAAPDALRYTGTHDLFLTPQFQAGAFEIQDLASQLVGVACRPQPGQTWWDACAGEGGKTLHLADLMQNKGLVWSTDRNQRRLDILKRRAARAQLFNYRSAVWVDSSRAPTRTKFDGILVDAPCSGVGTWQRNPHARWTATPDDIRELAAVQLALLNLAAASLKPGARLVYSVCTLTRAETTAVASAFTAAHPELEPAPVFGADLSGLGPQVQLWPHELNANGMFLAAWRRPA